MSQYFASNNPMALSHLYVIGWRRTFHKKVDVLDHKQLLKNDALLNEVLKDGVKIYG